MALQNATSNKRSATPEEVQQNSPDTVLLIIGVEEDQLTGPGPRTVGEDTPPALDPK